LHRIWQAVLETMLSLAQLGEEKQIRAQLVAIGERFQPLRAAREYCQRVG
jgi:hypothetical protein